MSKSYAHSITMGRKPATECVKPVNQVRKPMPKIKAKVNANIHRSVWQVLFGD